MNKSVIAPYISLKKSIDLKKNANFYQNKDFLTYNEIQ